MMKDSSIKILLCIVIPMIIIITFFLLKRLEDHTNICLDKGGVMVKTIDGWGCIDAKVMK
jgi:hypothetical protein